MVSKASPATKRGKAKASESELPSTSSSSSNPTELETVKTEFDQLCRELNMDTSTADSAWTSYTEKREKFYLEGNQMHWLACSLYVACRNSTLPTVGAAGATVQGNGVSLTRLLRSCKMSLIEFFNKAKMWADMSNLKEESWKKIDRLERNFNVSNVIFKKYQSIFVDLFKDPAKDPPKVNRSRKTKKPPCTPGDVFDFCWGLFVMVKALLPGISHDLVNSYHLLLSCVDHIYACAVLANRTDLLNEKFDGVTQVKDGRPCVLDKLCRLHDGIILEVKSIREHWWRRRIKELFDSKVLHGESDTLAGLLEPTNFEANNKAIRKEYEAYVLSIGEYDERVFLGEDAIEEIGTPAKLRDGTETAGDLGKKMVARRNLATQFEGTALMPSTPLSGKHYLRAKEQLNVTPVSTATYLVSRLNKLLGKRENEPSAKLKELFATCETDPTQAIVARVKEMSKTFCTQYTTANDSHPGSQESFARTRLHMGVVLYYKLLESILFTEKSKNKPLKNLLDQDLFHRALFTCCLEIVIFSYNSQRTFPWVLDTFKLEAIHFYKVIEVIIRAEDWLARDVVKHLQRIEEQILESRAWTKDSPLWDAIEKDPQGVPSCEEVSLPAAASGGHDLVTDVTQSPLSHHGRAFSVIKSPMAGDRFKSPVVTAVARRQLAFDGQTVVTSPIRAGQSVLASPQKPFVQSPTRVLGQTLQGDFIAIETDSGRPKRTGSLALFFRKVYHLAHLRLDMLCHTLDVIEEDIKRKIWTTFEHALRTHTDLMKDRHIDQILMCSLYIVCKVVGKNKLFTDIMKQYCNQPQAASHVYRSVLLHPVGGAATSVDNTSGTATSSGMQHNTPPTPTRLASTSTVVDGEERGDLIMFYNNVFMNRLQEFSLKFKRSRATDAPPLSPLPKLRAHPQSPCRKVSDTHCVFIRPLKSTPNDVVTYNPHSPHRPLSYSFSRSPSKDLAKINALMSVEKKSNVGKRLLSDDSTSAVIASEDEPPAKIQILPGGVNTKLELILGDRSTSDS